jgi:hypothetical protein
VGAGRILTHIREVEVEGYNEPSFGAYTLPHHPILGARQALVMDTVSLVAGPLEDCNVRAPEVLVELVGPFRKKGLGADASGWPAGRVTMDRGGFIEGVDRHGRANHEATVTLLLCGDVTTGRGIDQVLPHPWTRTSTNPI